METFDTNVVVRVLVEDDPQQSAVALRLWRQALASGGVFLPKLVLAETVWVLKVAFQCERSEIASILAALLTTAGVTVEDEPQVRAALKAYAAGPADFSDYLILETARHANALPVKTFDRRFARDPDTEAMPGQ